MPETYTLFIAKALIDQDDRVIARRLTLAEASIAICKHDGAVSHTTDRDYGSFRVQELKKFDAKMKLKVVIGATVPATDSVVSDRLEAQRLIDTHRSSLDPMSSANAL